MVRIFRVDSLRIERELRASWSFRCLSARLRQSSRAATAAAGQAWNRRYRTSQACRSLATAIVRQQPDNGRFPMLRRHDSDADIEIAPGDAKARRTVLREPPLGNIEARQKFMREITAWASAQTGPALCAAGRRSAFAP